MNLKLSRAKKCRETTRLYLMLPKRLSIIVEPFLLKKEWEFPACMWNFRDLKVKNLLITNPVKLLMVWLLPLLWWIMLRLSLSVRISSKESPRKNRKLLSITWSILLRSVPKKWVQKKSRQWKNSSKMRKLQKIWNWKISRFSLMLLLMVRCLLTRIWLTTGKVLLTSSLKTTWRKIK